MVEFKMKTNKKGYGSVPIEIRKHWGNSLVIIPNAEAAVLFREGQSLERVKKSVEILLRDLELRCECEEKEKDGRNEGRGEE